jgi:ribosome-associated protein
VSSKSERKRQQLELQELGEKLIELKEADLADLALDEKLREAVRVAANIKSHGALRRQKQYIGKLMRDIDPEPIRAALARLNADEMRDKRLFARAERWRDRIVHGDGDTLAEFNAETGVDDTELRGLLAELEVAFDERSEKTVRRKIFRRVHELLTRGAKPKGSDPI